MKFFRESTYFFKIVLALVFTVFVSIGCVDLIHEIEKGQPKAEWSRTGGNSLPSEE